MQELFGIKSPLATERQRFSLTRPDDRELMRRRVSFNSIRIMLASPETIRGGGTRKLAAGEDRG